MTMVLTRRRLLATPPSRLAIWARRLAVFSLAAVVLAVAIERADMLESGPIMVTFAAALTLALLGILFALASFVVLWQDGGRGFGQALSAVLIGLALLGYPAYLGYKGYSLPTIKDITTDPIDPPRFEVVARLRPANSNIYPGLATAELQKEAWPFIDPLLVSISPKAAFDAAYAIMSKRKWRIVDARPPQGNRDGHIEAIARSPILGLRDDVVVRVRAVRNGARVDIRSAARYGYTDFGSNAERVLALLDEIDDDASNDKPDRQERAVKPAPKVAAKPNQAARR
jgi:uncharacterized protein (DUF1499 family)